MDVGRPRKNVSKKDLRKIGTFWEGLKRVLWIVWDGGGVCVAVDQLVGAALCFSI